MTAHPRARVWNNALILFAGTASGALLSFLLSVIIGRMLGAQGLGTVTTVLAWIYPLSLLAEGGVNTWMIRHIASDPAQTAAAVQGAIRIRLLTALPLCLALVLGAPLLSDDPAIIAGLRISAPLIWIVPTAGIFNSVFRGNQRMLPVALLNAGMLLVQVILLWIALHNGGSALDALAINTLTSAGQLIVALLLVCRSQHAPTTGRIPLLTILRHALPFAAAGVLAALQTRISFLLLDQFAGSSAVGFYAASMRFIEAGRLFPQAYLEALYPTLTALASDPSALRTVFRSAIRRLLLVGLAVTVVLLSLGGVLLTGLFGESFRPALPVLLLLTLSLPLLIMKGVRTLYWYAHLQERFTNLITLLALLVQITISSYLIPTLGATGAALALLAAELVAVLGLWLRR